MLGCEDGCEVGTSNVGIIVVSVIGANSNDGDRVGTKDRNGEKDGETVGTAVAGKLLGEIVGTKLGWTIVGSVEAGKLLGE